MTDYEKLYQEEKDVCGKPSKVLIWFFDKHQNTKLNVLDLGCGQGRDALMIGRKGHSVLGIDISPTGIKQMQAVANIESLNVEGIVGDIQTFVPSKRFDIIVIDRVLRMLSSDYNRFLVLTMAINRINPNGYILIVDTYGVKIFNNISNSESQHMSAIKMLLDKYGIADPVDTDEIGVFTNDQLSDLYQALLDIGNTSLLDAYMVGATIEDLDIYDLMSLSDSTDNEDILYVYDNLTRGSRNHIRSFLEKS